MKKTFTFSSFILLLTFSFSQNPYFNEWFASDPDRPFVKLLVSVDAIYEVTASDLLAAGHDLSQAAPDSIQMYYRGEEIPLTVEQDAQGRLASFTFYGRRNDGGVEAQMYRNPISGTPDPSQQPNPNFSLYSDTAAYFLTWGSDQGLRYTTAMDTNYSNYTPEVSYPYESVWEPHPDSQATSDEQAIPVFGGGSGFDAFHWLNSNFGPGEGYISEKSFRRGQPFITSFLETPGPIQSSQNLRIQMRIFHRSNTEHRTRATLVNNPAVLVIDTTINFNAIAVKTYSRTIHVPLTTQTDLKFETLGIPYDQNHLTSIRMRYERLPDMANQARTQISEWNRNVTSYFRFANPLGQNKIWAYDPANEIRYEGRISGGDANLVLSGRFYGKTLEVVTDQGFQKPIISRSTSLRNLCDPDSGVQFVLIAHRDVALSAQAYATYRDSTLLGYKPLSAKVIFIDEIYEEFSYGAPTPQAIQQFLNCAVDNWSVKPEYCFLWGKGKVWLRSDSTAMIPSYGFPANDVRFTTLWNEDRTAQLAIGRLNIYNDQEGMDYLDKVKEFERLGDESWRKEGVFIGAGRTEGEVNFIADAINNFVSCFEDSLTIDGHATVFAETLGASSLITQARIDQGVAMLYFLGINDQTSPALLEAFEYANFGKYPLFMGMGAIGGEWSLYESYSERWVKEPARGAIAFLGNSTTSFLTPHRDYGRIFFCGQLGPKARRPIGEIVRLTYQKMVDSLPGVQFLNHARQMNLQGDPFLVIFPNSINTSILPPILQKVIVYPNPTGEKLTISSTADQIEAISLYNLQGQMLLEKTGLFVNEAQLDVSGLAPGHYFVQYKTRTGLGVEKIVKK